MEELLKRYIELFGEGFPMYQIGRSRTQEEICDIIDECLKKKQDAYELGYAKEEVIY